MCANEQNFPKVNDYRNIVVAVAMKVLGFVNRHSRGVQRVQKDLKANENSEAIYDFSYQTAVLVTENKSLRGERATSEAIANGFLDENDQKPSDMTENDEGKQTKKTDKIQDTGVSNKKRLQKTNKVANSSIEVLAEVQD